MGLHRGPNIVTDGLVLCLDAPSKRSYPRTGNTWYDLSGNDNHFTIGSSVYYNNHYKAFFLGHIPGRTFTYSSQITTSTNCTFVFWMQNGDTQALYWQGQTGSHYLGAYKSSNKEYHSGFGSPDVYVDTVARPNLYDYNRDGLGQMIEFKNVDMSGITSNGINNYTNYQFFNATISMIKIYDRNLSAAESQQNYNAIINRYSNIGFIEV